MTALVSAQIVLNDLANWLGRLLTPIGMMPGWLSATLVAMLTGVVMLLAFKYTSNQQAIRRVRRGIKADLLSVRLFQDNLAGALRSQGRVLLGAAKLLLLALVPMLVLTAPMVLLLAQLGLWYQAAPAPIGQETIVAVALDSSQSESPNVELLPSNGIEVLVGPVRVSSKREVCWQIRALRPGYHRLQFRVDGETVEKEFAAGAGVMRVSLKRPGQVWSDILFHPAEPPFRPNAAVRSIEIEHPSRSSWTCGADRWVVYWFAVSLLAGFCLRGAFDVSF